MRWPVKCETLQMADVLTTRRICGPIFEIKNLTFAFTIFGIRRQHHQKHF